MKRLAPTGLWQGSWTSVCLSVGFCAGLTMAIASYVDARAEGRKLFAGPRALTEASGVPIFSSTQEACKSPEVLGRRAEAKPDSVPLVPLVVCAESRTDSSGVDAALPKASESKKRPRSKRTKGRRGAIQGAVVGAQIEAAVQTRTRPAAASPAPSPVHLEEFGDAKLPAGGGTGMNWDGR